MNPKLPFGFSGFRGVILALVGDRYETITEAHARDLLADLTADTIAHHSVASFHAANHLARALGQMEAHREAVMLKDARP